MSEIWDYYDSDMVHVTRGLLGNHFRKRGSFISNKQMRFKVMSEVHKEIMSNIPYWNEVARRKDFGEFLNLIGEKILDYSCSVDGYVLGKGVEAVQSRLAVGDIRKNVGGDKVDLEES